MEELEGVEGMEWLDHSHTGRNCICSQSPHCSSIYLLTNLIVLLNIVIIAILAWCVDG